MNADDAADIFCRWSIVGASRPIAAPIVADLYKWRHLIENFFGKLKEFKRIAMRADKTDTSFKAAIYLAAAAITPR